MATVGAYEAKTHFSALLERVQRGEEIMISKHGTPVAKLVPIEGGLQRPVKEVIAEMRETQKHCRLNGLTIREMIEDGRRY